MRQQLEGEAYSYQKGEGNERKNSTKLQIIKRNLLYDALTFNMKAQENKSFKKINEKKQEREQEALVNRRVETEVQMEKQIQKRKKSQIAKSLAREYEQQMIEKKKFQEEERKRNRSYGIIQLRNQDVYHERRAKQLGRIYKRQANNSFQKSKTEQNSEQISDKFTQYQKRLKYPPSRVTQTIEPEENLGYKDYLERQINRRRKIKEEEKNQQLQRDKYAVERMKNSYQKDQEFEREYLRQRKLNFRKGLDEQIAGRKRNMIYQ